MKLLDKGNKNVQGYVINVQDFIYNVIRSLDL